MKPEDWTIFIIAVCVVLVLLPPRYDPLIRWKEHLSGWPKHKGRGRKP